MKVHYIGGRLYLVANKLANFSRTGIGNGEHLNELGILNSVDLGSSETGIKVNTPVSAEPYEGLAGNNDATPNKSPFLGANVFVVEVLTQIVTEEDGPCNGKGPDVGMEVER